jgi:hypothetical protein
MSTTIITGFIQSVSNNFQSQSPKARPIGQSVSIRLDGESKEQLEQFLIEHSIDCSLSKFYEIYSVWVKILPESVVEGVDSLVKGLEGKFQIVFVENKIFLKKCIVKPRPLPKPLDFSEIENLL